MSVMREYYPKAFGGKYKLSIERFSSATEITDTSNRRNITDDDFRYEFNRDELYEKFNGVPSWEKACDLLHKGYATVVPKLQNRIEMTAKGEGVKTAFRNDVVGFAPVVPLAMMGVPNSMVNTYRKPIRNKVLNIYYDRTALANRSQRQIEDTAVKFVSTLIDLEMQGYRFNLTVVKTQADSKDADMLMLKIKDANAPLDLQRMTYPLVHTAFARVTCWDWYSRCPIARYRGGFGHNLSIEKTNEQIQNAIEEITGEKCIYFSLEDMIDKPEHYIKDRILDANKRYA